MYNTGLLKVSARVWPAKQTLILWISRFKICKAVTLLTKLQNSTSIISSEINGTIQSSIRIHRKTNEFQTEKETLLTGGVELMGGGRRGESSEQHRSLIGRHVFSAACVSKTLPSWIFMSWWNEILSLAQISRGVGRLERSTGMQNMLSVRRRSVLVKRRCSRPAVVACCFAKSLNWPLPPNHCHYPKVKNNKAKRLRGGKKSDK